MAEAGHRVDAPVMTEEDRLFEELVQRVLSYNPQADVGLLRRAYETARAGPPEPVPGVGRGVRAPSSGGGPALGGDGAGRGHLGGGPPPRRAGGHGRHPGGAGGTVRARDPSPGRRGDQALQDPLPVPGRAPGPIPAEDVPGHGRGPAGDRHQAGRPPPQHADPGPAAARAPQEDCRETLEIYAPLAHRLGMWSFKWEMEDLAFRHLDPEAYYALAGSCQETAGAGSGGAGGPPPSDRTPGRRGFQADIQGRPKHLYSIYQKMRRQGKDLTRSTT